MKFFYIPMILLDQTQSPKAEVDVRKQFFYSILQSSGKSATFESVNKEQSISSSIKRSRSESDLDQSVDATDKEPDASAAEDKLEVSRPRSASPTVGSQVKGDGRIDEEHPGQKGQEGQEGQEEVTSANESSSVVASGGIATLKTRGALQRHRSEDLAGSSRAASKVPPVTKSKSVDYDIGEDAKMKTTFIGAGVPEEEEDNSKEEKQSLQASPSQSTPKGKCRPYIDIPEFNWSPLHQRLLSELLFAIESDIQVWKTYVKFDIFKVI